MNSVPLKEISKQISSGITPLRSNEEFWNSKDVPWVKTEQLGNKNIYDSNEKISFTALEQTSLKLNPINTLSIAMYGEGKTRGSVSILKKEMTTNQACCNIEIDKTKAHYEYIYYYLTTQYQQLRNLSSGVRKNLNSNDIKNFEIRLPDDIQTQKSIAKVLSDLDAKIELNNKINRELEAMAKTLYDYWFVQFDFPCLPQDYRPSGQVNPNSELATKIKSVCTYKQTGGLPFPDGKKWFVYVIECADETLYKGITNDIYRRYYEHYKGQGADWTKAHKPKRIIHYEEFETQKEAAKREKELKTGYGRTWLKREYEKLVTQEQTIKEVGLPAHQTRLVKAGKMVYKEELKREIPEGWEVGTFGYYSTVKSGFAFKSSWWQETGVPVVKIKDIQEDYTLNLNDFSFVGSDKVETAKRFKSKAGDVVIAMTGATIGKFAMIPYSDDTILVNQRVGLYDLGDEPFLKLSYLLNSMKQDFFRGKVFQIAGGAAQPNISGEQLDSFPLLKPNNELIYSYNYKFKSTYKRIANNIKQNQQLTALRDWLLPMLMNGQVTVRQSHGSAVGEVALQQVQSDELNISAEPQAEYDKKVSIPLLLDKEEKPFLKRKVLASYIINQSLDDIQFGDVKFEKLLHLADYFAIQRNLGQKYIQKAAGPYDNSFTYPFFKQVIGGKWFKKEKLGNLNRIKAGVNQSKSTKTYNFFSEEELERINKLIDYFKSSNYERPEIISTLYAVWNNRIIRKQAITDELLKKDFLNWDKQKIKYKNRLDGALEWMQKEGIIPNGWGKVIEKT